MKYGLFFLLLALIAAYGAIVAVHPFGRVVCALAAIAMMVVALAYLRSQPRLLFKRSDGGQPWWAWVLLWPYFGLTWLSYWVYVLVDRRPAMSEVAPGIWLGRWPVGRAAREKRGEWAAVVDMTAEFPRAPLGETAYLCLPVLDGMAPSPEQFQQAVAWIARHGSGGPVLIHCALGHGRSASIAAAWLEYAGLAGGVNPVHVLQSARPGVGLNPAQIHALLAYRQELSRPIERPSPLDSRNNIFPARVLGVLSPRHVRVVVTVSAQHGSALVSDGLGPDLPIDMIAPELRAPNTPVWVEWGPDLQPVRVLSRKDPAPIEREGLPAHIPQP